MVWCDTLRCTAEQHGTNLRLPSYTHYADKWSTGRRRFSFASRWLCNCLYS